MNFENVYVLDTNIILNDASDIFTISQQGSNLIVLPENLQKGDFGRGKCLGRSGCGVWEHIKVQLIF
jgi:hypothetical protein